MRKDLNLFIKSHLSYICITECRWYICIYFVLQGTINLHTNEFRYFKISFVYKLYVCIKVT